MSALLIMMSDSLGPDPMTPRGDAPVKTPRRRSLGSSVRVALTSGAAAVGWLMLGATGADAAEDGLTLPAPNTATAITQVVAGPAPVDEALLPARETASAEVLPGDPVAASMAPAKTLVQDAAPAVQEPVAAVTASVEEIVGAAPAVDEVLPVEPVTRLVEDPVSVVQSPVETVETVVEPVTRLVEDPVSVVQSPVETVQTVVEPITPVVEEIAPVTVPVPVVPASAAVVEDVVSAAPVVEELLPAAPVIRIVEDAPAPVVPDTAATPATPAVVETPAATVETPSAQPERLPAETSTSSGPVLDQPAASTDVESSAQADRPSPADFLSGLAQFRAIAETATALNTAPALGEVSSAAGGTVLPGAGSTASAGSGGGSGTPLRGAGPDSWPVGPADLPYLTIFPQLTAAQDEAFFAELEQPPGSPAFDPGSTPD